MMQTGTLFLIMVALAPAARAISDIPPTRLDILPPSTAEITEWRDAKKAARSAQAQKLAALVAGSAVESCAPDNWIHVDERGVVCQHPNWAALNDGTQSAFIETVLIPTSEIIKARYAVVAESADEKGEGALLAEGRERVDRKAVYILIVNEQKRRVRALKVEGMLRLGAETIKR